VTAAACAEASVIDREERRLNCHQDDGIHASHGNTDSVIVRGVKIGLVDDLLSTC